MSSTVPIRIPTICSGSTLLLDSSAEQRQLGVEALLANARSGASIEQGELLQIYRNYLTVLASTQLDRRLRRRMSPSDLVQDTMLAAHRDFMAFRGGSERELLASPAKLLKLTQTVILTNGDWANIV